MSPDTQTKLLRAIQEHAIRPLGFTREVKVDGRLIATTNREPDDAVKSNHLRRDLYYRLQASVLRLPPLRDRLEDVSLIAAYFIDLFNEKRLRMTPVIALESDALDAMQTYQWPGNVRELSNAIESAFTFGRSPMIRLADLPPNISGQTPQRDGIQAPVQGGAVSTYVDAERDLIVRALEMADWNKARAARTL